MEMIQQVIREKDTEREEDRERKGEKKIN